MDETFSAPPNDIPDEVTARAQTAARRVLDLAPAFSDAGNSYEPGEPHTEEKYTSSHEIAIRDKTIAEQLEYIKQLEHENRHDSLTGLLNKKALKAAIESRIAEGKAFGIAFVDLDGFKQVNDRLGHEQADRLLEQLGGFLDTRFRRGEDVVGYERLIKNSEEGYHTGRYGGDEIVFAFGVTANDRRGHDLHENTDHEYDYISAVFKEFVDSQPDDVKACDFGASIGIALYDPARPVDAATLIAQADEAMREEKQDHKGAR